MRVHIGKYKDYISPFHLTDLLKYLGVSVDTRDCLAAKLPIEPFNWINDKRNRKIKVHIDKYDTWSMDNTLAHIIYPMLLQLNATKHGAPFVDDDDVPKNLSMTKKEMEIFNYGKNEKYTGKQVEEANEKFFAKWDWIMGEMIWAFGTKVCEYDRSRRPAEFNCDFDDKEVRDRIANGFRLFGKYYSSLWD